jgi:hypothetical protein
LRTLVVRRSVGDCGNQDYTRIAENETELTPPLHSEKVVGGTHWQIFLLWKSVIFLTRATNAIF